ncbi:MAG TPA: hypothetical protein VNA69_20865 [Thermoanaerobaculia bacterium]|nr:hypothetical protein [Thermoanaerobaculia bacterium]
MLEFLKRLRTYRGVRVITCPENRNAAAVRVALWDSRPDLHLRSCTRWPEKAGCGQECLAQIEASPRECLVQSIVASWYAGRSCTFCAKPIGEIVWHERPPAVRFADGTTREWKEIAAEELPAVFASAQPVCFVCHIVESFRHDHPEMVIERKRIAEARSTLRPSTTVY